jgi:hypothetical protein
MATLRYLGVIATTFNDIGEVEPLGTFEVEDEHAGSYLRRADIERVDALPAPEPESKSEEPLATAAE